MDCCMVFKRAGAAAVIAAVLFGSVSAAEQASVREGIQGVYNRKSDGGSVLDALTPGESNSDWLAYAVGEYGIEDNYQGYLDRLAAVVAEKYAEQGTLDKNRATEWHRIALTVKALGGNPSDFGGADLLKDGITEPLVKLDRQGINGLIWAAVAAQECGAEFSGETTLKDICNEIVERQNPDGGFSLSGDSDPDITAMAIRAICGVPGFRPYAELARAALLGMRLPSGGYASYGVENCESAAQVILALCAMGEQPDAEVDVLLSYRNPDGGFAHAYGGESDDMASVQAMLALIAYDKALASAEEAPETEEQPVPAAETEAQTEEQPAAQTEEAQPAVSEAESQTEQTETQDEQPEAEALPEETEPDSAAPEEEVSGETASEETEAADENGENSSTAAVISVAGAAVLAVAAYLLSKRMKSK